MDNKYEALRRKVLSAPKNGYDRISAADLAAMEPYCRDYIDFISTCKVEREAVEWTIAEAEKVGFKPLVPGMQLRPGDKVYGNNHKKSVIFAVIGRRSLNEGAHICAAHIDSPRLDLKPNPLYEDSEINAAQPIVDDEICKMADIRKSNGGKPILHASVSAKYTMRSDRAQNSRTEALNLIRNRKGHLPHIVVVTAEPMPNRLASLALGTGDIDCVYHFALYELIRAVKEAGSEDAVETLETLVQGKRLKDISDLPLDLSV